MLKRILIAFSLIWVSHSFAADLSAATAMSQKIKVGILIQKKEPPVDLIALDVWSQIAKQLKIHFQLIKLNNINNAFHALSSHQIDLLLGPIKATRNNQHFLYLDSYITDSLGMVVPIAKLSEWSRVLPIIKSIFGWGLVLLIILHLIIGGLIWFVERKDNPGFQHENVFKGVITGFWYAWVTMTTVGYGDYVPVTMLGRLIATVWMLVALVIISAISVLITAELTTAKVSSRAAFHLSQLKDQKVLYVKNNQAALKLIQKYSGRAKSISSVKVGLNLIAHKEAQVGIFDRIQARYVIKKNPDLMVSITDYMFDYGHYAFVMREGDPLALNINAVLFTMEQTGVLQKIETKWLGNSDLPYLQSDIK